MMNYGYSFYNDTSGFYKLNENNTLTLSKVVEEFNLTEENKNQYEFPINGWYWFNSEAEARTYFELPESEIIPTFFWFDLIDPLVLKPQCRPKYNND